MKDLQAILTPILLVFVCLPMISIAASCETGGKMTESKPTLPITVGLWTRAETPQLITSETIFDYMDGAGELYLGYCFDHLEVYVAHTNAQSFGDATAQTEGNSDEEPVP